MKDYKQLTYEQRCQIEALNKRGLSQREIAETAGTSQSTISRELRRNRGGCGYRCQQAQRKTVERRKDAVKPWVMTDAMLDLVAFLLRQRWSPEQISGWLLHFKGWSVSYESIYLYVWADKKKGGELHAYLRRKGKKYQWRGSNGKTLRGQIKNRVSIEERPASVAEKIEVGHWEIDTVIGKGHSGALVTIVERVTRFTVSARVKRACAKAVTAATVTLLTPFKSLVHTITADNGKEFAWHEKIAKQLDCKFYFAHPYHSWERGLNENTNGLLRQYFPKKTDFKEVKTQQVIEALRELNDRPRKVLAFRSPADLMQIELAAIAA